MKKYNNKNKKIVLFIKMIDYLSSNYHNLLKDNIL